VPELAICLDCGAMTAPPTTGPMLCARCSSVRAARSTPRKRSHQERRSSPEALARRAESQRFYNSGAWRRTRDAVRKRDGACLMCGSRHRLTVDHIVPRRDAPELAFEPSNLRTLCASCHGKKDGARSRETKKISRDEKYFAENISGERAEIFMKGDRRPPGGKPSRGVYGETKTDPVFG
jgi:5-methylcytosine-specific restriction endonuclease McrA